MPATQRQFDASVIQRLLDEPYRFEFFQAVRVIELWLRQNGVAHDRTLLDYVRFQNSASLSFAASQIEALVPESDIAIETAASLLEALVGKQLRHIRIRPAFMGFLGANGSLPLHYSERIAAHEHAAKDEGPRAFLDIFSNRALALFYQAWAKYRVEYKLDLDGNDGYLPMLLAFAGMERGVGRKSEASFAACAAADPGEIMDETLAYYAAQIRSRSVSASVVAGVLCEYFNVPIGLEQFAGAWDVLSSRQRTALGGTNCHLGAGATLGERIWRHDLSLHIRIGPLDRQDFDCFLPGANGARALRTLLGTFATGAPHCEVQLILRAQDVHGVCLTAAGASRLGLDSFLSTEAETKDREDVCYWIDLNGHQARHRRWR